MEHEDKIREPLTEIYEIRNNTGYRLCRRPVEQVRSNTSANNSPKYALPLLLPLSMPLLLLPLLLPLSLPLLLPLSLALLLRCYAAAAAC